NIFQVQWFIPKIEYLKPVELKLYEIDPSNENISPDNKYYKLEPKGELKDYVCNAYQDKAAEFGKNKYNGEIVFIPS
ncbi:MAG: hypothetical protein C4278_02445, partial [Patescibacteria group bacterium]